MICDHMRPYATICDFIKPKYGRKTSIYNISCWLVYSNYTIYDVSHMRHNATCRCFSQRNGRVAGISFFRSLKAVFLNLLGIKFRLKTNFDISPSFSPTYMCFQSCFFSATKCTEGVGFALIAFPIIFFD